MATCARILVTLALVLAATHQALPYPEARYRRMQPEVVQVVPLESEGETRSVESVEDDSIPSEETYPRFPQEPVFPIFPFGRPWPSRPLFNFNIDPTPLFHPFSDILRRLETEMDAIWRNIRVKDTTNPLGVGSEIDIGKLPANYTNTTTTTKVVNGQTMVVNETIHKSTIGGGESFFRVQVINMKPKINVEVPAEAESTSTSEQAETAESAAASIPQLNVRAATSSGESASRRQPVVEYPPASENEIDVDDAEEIKVERPIDLSSDIRVNQLLADEAKAGKLFMVNPDAELVDVEEAEDGTGARVRPRPRPFFHQMALPMSRAEFESDDVTAP